MKAVGHYKKLTDCLSALLNERHAVTSIEYAVIALIIVLAVVGGVTHIGGELAVPLNQVASEL